MLVDIQKLNLGSDSAERDITVGLSEYFYQNSTYQKFLNSKKTILVGNRGTGKSAIFKYIASTEAKKGVLVLARLCPFTETLKHRRLWHVSLSMDFS